MGIKRVVKDALLGTTDSSSMSRAPGRKIPLEAWLGVKSFRARLEESVNMRSGNTVRPSFTNVTIWTVAAAFGLMVCSAVSSQAAEPGSGGLDVVQVRPNF